jgi:hypothetical protein
MGHVAELVTLAAAVLVQAGEDAIDLSLKTHVAAYRWKGLRCKQKFGSGSV